MKKIWFLRALEISLLLFIALFFITASIQAQGYRDFPYNYYNYDDFYTLDSWGPSFLMNFQNNYGYGQGNWGAWPQVNSQPFYSSGDFLPTPSWHSAEWGDNLYMSSTPVYSDTFRSPGFYEPRPSNSGLPDLASIAYDPSRQTYGLSFRPGNIRPGGIYFGSGWTIYFPDSGGLSPMLISNGQLTTWEDTQEIKTITEEDYGETIVVHIGKLFRILLPAPGYSSQNDFDSINGKGWVQEDSLVHNVTKSKSKKITDSGYEQENRCEAVNRGERELIFNFYSLGDPDNIEDTFRVTIRVE